MLNMLKRLFKTECKHDWDESSPYDQTCKKCNYRRVLMSRRFPKVGEPAIYWREVKPISEILDKWK